MWLARKLRKALSRAGITRSHDSADLGRSLDFSLIGEAGPLATKILRPLHSVPGWFNVDDCGHFFLVLSLQSALDVKGDLLEIGSYHGRSTALMAYCLNPGERIVVCDAFESDTDDKYARRPSPDMLVSNITRVNPHISRDRIIIHPCLSTNLQLAPDDQFRFIHIDGGHSAEQVYADLNLCGKHLMPSGIMAVDDYHHVDWPGVTEGTDRFLSRNYEYSVLADLNRHGAKGRKLYLIKRPELLIQ